MSAALTAMMVIAAFVIGVIVGALAMVAFAFWQTLHAEDIDREALADGHGADWAEYYPMGSGQ